MKKVLTVVLLVAAFCSCKKTDTPTPTVLPAPSNLSVQLINNKASLNWTNHSSSYVGIKVERKLGTGAFSLLVSLNGSTLSYTDSTVKADSVYTYRVYGYNNSDNSAYSNEVYIAPVTLLNTGSNWRYAFATGTDSATAQRDTFTLTVLSYDSIIQGNHYKILGDSLNKYNLFFRSVGDTDFRRGLFSTIKGGLIPDIEEKFYLENKTAGTTWTLPIDITIAGFGKINATNNYSIISLTDTLTVNNIFYSNVSHVQIVVKALIPSLGVVVVGGGDFYYAQGYGALKYVFSVNYLGVKLYQSETLLSSHLK